MTALPPTALPPIPTGADAAVREQLLAMADDELVIGWSDSEWTGIAPLLEEDVAMSSIAQDELGHALALYQLAAAIPGEDRDPDALAFDRPPTAYRHARLLDHGRGDWAMTIARRFLYETADAIRLDAVAGSSWAPLRELVAKVQREERYHRLHIDAWLERLATDRGAARARLEAAWATLAPDAASVFTPLPGEPAALEAGLLAAGAAEQERAWRRAIGPVLRRLGLPMPPPAAAVHRGRTDHGSAFAWLHGEMTRVRHADPGATW